MYIECISGQLSIATSKNPSVVNTTYKYIYIKQDAFRLFSLKTFSTVYIVQFFQESKLSAQTPKELI